MFIQVSKCLSFYGLSSLILGSIFWWKNILILKQYYLWFCFARVLGFIYENSLSPGDLLLCFFYDFYCFTLKLFDPFYILFCTCYAVRVWFYSLACVCILVSAPYVGETFLLLMLSCLCTLSKINWPYMNSFFLDFQTRLTSLYI